MRTLILLFLFLTLIQGVRVTLYVGTGCSTSPITLDRIPLRTTTQCFSNYDSDSLGSAQLRCPSAADPTWSLSVWYAIVGAPSYTCGGAAFAVATGTGTACVDGAGYSVSVDCAAPETTVQAAANGVVAQMGSNDPFALRLASGSSIGSKYLNVRYSMLAELNGGNPVTAPTGTHGSFVFHYVPLTDMYINFQLSAAFVASSANANFNFAGYVGNLQQTATNVAKAMMINFIAKDNFNAASYDIAASIPAIAEPICLRGSSSGTCTSFPVVAGQTKMAFGLFNWQFDGASTHFRIQYTLQPVGFTGATIYFNGLTSNVCNTFAGTVNTVTVAEPSGYNFTMEIQDLVNAGDNTFVTASVTADFTTECLLNIDIPLQDLTTGANSWFLYDPLVQNNSPATSDAAHVSVSLLAMTVLAALSAMLF